MVHNEIVLKISSHQEVKLSSDNLIMDKLIEKALKLAQKLNTVNYK